MENRIQELFRKRGIKVANFAKENGITPTTLYAIHSGKTKFEKISVSVFIKIANGLGMTVEELFYGEKEASRRYTDPRQEQLNGCYESLNDESKTQVSDMVKSIAADPSRRVEKVRGENMENPADMEGVA